MFVSVKERARQIASGQFIAPATNAPVASLIDLAPEPKPATIAPSKKGVKDSTAKAIASPSKSKVSKTVSPKDVPKAAPTPAAPPKAAPPKAATSKATPIGAFPETIPTKPTPPPEASTPKKSSSKSKLTKEVSSKPTKEPSSKPSTPKLGSSKPTSSSKATSQPKVPSSPKLASPTKPTAPRPSLFSRASSTPTTPTTPKPKRAKSPPKRVDSPISDSSSSSALSDLKSACLKQVSGITGLGGRRLAIALKQRSSGEYYVALKDVSSDKYLKIWMNRDKTYESKEEALEAYLVWVSKKRNEVRWFPMSPRASSPGSKGKK